MKRLYYILIFMLLSLAGFAQTEVVSGDTMKACGLDRLYDFDSRQILTAPKGYEAFYVSHYGRHGSRYPYSPRTVTVLLEMLREGQAQGNLTDFGADMLIRLEAFWEQSQYSIGDLTDLGRAQQARLAADMVSDFPAAFGRGAVVEAQSSASGRAIVSMAAFCVSLGRNCPKLEINIRQGIHQLQATAPNISSNPLRISGPGIANPYPETPDEYMRRRFPEYPEVLGTMFREPLAALGERNHEDVLDHVYMLVCGMNSIPEEARIDVDGIFTPESFAAMWEVDNYQRFVEYVRYTASCCPVFNDIITRANKRIKLLGEDSDKACGADLRFGHDHVLMTLLMMANVDHCGELPADADSLGYIFQTFRSPMATNLQFVFYRPKHGKGDILMRLYLNGIPARFTDIDKSKGNNDDYLYTWDEVKAYLEERIAVLCGK